MYADLTLIRKRKNIGIKSLMDNKVEFQVKGFNLMVERDYLILADDAGLGKSFQVATAMEARKKLGKVKRGIIIAKASLLFNWRDEIHMHTHEKAIVISGTQKQRTNTYHELRRSDDWTFIVMSYETFRGDIQNLQYVDSYKPLDFCVIDEAHKIKNPTSKVGEVIHFIPFKCRYVLTATPLPNSPLESYNYLKFGKVIDMNWWHFQNRYAVMGGFGKKEVIGYQNIRELKTFIQSNMLRRRKHDKLKELPEVTFKTLKVTMTKEQDKLYNAVKKEILEDLKDTSLDKVPASLAKLVRLQQITDSTELIGAEPSKNSSAKITVLDDLIDDLVDNGGEKVIIFSRFRGMIDLLEQRYERYNPAVIHGDIDAGGVNKDSATKQLKKKYGNKWAYMDSTEKEKLVDELTTSDRQRQVYKFQKDEGCKVFLGCTSACREGLTLTKATQVIFLDCEWSPSYVEQAYSRAHRIGQKNAVTVTFLVCENTIDEHVQDTLKRKESMAQMMIDQGIETVGTAKAKELISSLAGIELPYTKVKATV